jgi:hypothetical protein
MDSPLWIRQRPVLRKGEFDLHRTLNAKAG